MLYPEPTKATLRGSSCYLCFTGRKIRPTCEYKGRFKLRPSQLEFMLQASWVQNGVHKLRRIMMKRESQPSPLTSYSEDLLK